MALSMSVSGGRHNARHNTDPSYRKNLPNVDPELTHRNVVLRDEPVRDAYRRLFGQSVEAYNAAQVAKGHPERAIEDYYAKIHRSWREDLRKVEAGLKGKSNVPQPVEEYVIQIGSHETWGSVPTDTLVAIYRETFERLQARTAGAIDWFQAAIHLDEPEGSPHMHVAGIAYGTGNRRGLETQVSVSQALRALGLQTKPDLQDLLMRQLEDVAEEHGIERDVKGCDRRHQDVPEWKQTQRDIAADVERLERKQRQIQQAEERLECLQREEEQLRGEVAELESAAESVGESARYLADHRGDGGRAEELEREVEAARRAVQEREGEVERVEDEDQELAREVARAASEVRNLERRAARLEERVREAQRVFEGLRDAVRGLAARFRAAGGRVVMAASAGWLRHSRTVANEAGDDVRRGMTWQR